VKIPWRGILKYVNSKWPPINLASYQLALACQYR
jgi:hypothetical protein